MKIKVSENLQNLAKILGKKSDLYIVGGFVRDQLLGLPTGDVDLCGALTVTQIKNLLSKTNYEVKEISKKLGTAKIVCQDEKYEYSTFRKETYLNNGNHSPSEVEFIQDIKQDAKRRDFTVNCLYYNINKNQIIDFYNGIQDIKKRKIRCIETPQIVFKNDGLRILRMIRQASQLNFKIASETYHYAKKMIHMLEDISCHRKFEELNLVLDIKNKYNFINPYFMKGLRLFNKLGIWKYYFKELTNVKYSMVKRVSSNNRLTGLIIDIVDTVNPDCVSYYLEQELYNIGEPKIKTAKLIEIVCGFYDALNLKNNKDYFFMYFKVFGDILPVLERKAPLVARKYNFFYKYIIKYKVPVRIKDLKINGNDIKQNYPQIPQKKYSYILTDLLNKVFRAEIDNNKECLIEEVKNYDY